VKTQAYPTTDGEPQDTRQIEVKTKKDRKLPLKRDTWPVIRDRPNMAGTKSRFMVDLRPRVKGKGSRLYFATLEEAKQKAKDLAFQHANQGKEALHFPTELRIEAMECTALLEPFGVSLREAVQHYVKWAGEHRQRSESRSMNDCFADFMAACELDMTLGEISKLTYHGVRKRINQLKAIWSDTPIMAVSRQDVLQHLDDLKLSGKSARTRINTRAVLSKFFNFTVEKGWIAHSPCAGIKIKAAENDVTTLTVEQAEALMNAASEAKYAAGMVPYFALCLFAGLRPSEARRLDWSRIRFEDGRIEILKSITKTKRRRWAKIEANGLEWLKPHRKASGLIVDFSEMTWKRQFHWIRDKAGMSAKGEGGNDVQWDEDIMRHSYASYWLAVHKNAAELAELMGNTVTIIRKNYENAMLESVGKQYWAIEPS